MNVGMEYTVFNGDAGPVAGAYALTPEMEGMPVCWMPYFAVTDPDATAEKARSLGGTVLKEPARSEERRVGKECSTGWAADQAEDGIRDLYVTGVQTCALPIYERGDGVHRVQRRRRPRGGRLRPHAGDGGDARLLDALLRGDGPRRHGREGEIPRRHGAEGAREIGRASCRERV